MNLCEIPPGLNTKIDNISMFNICCDKCRMRESALIRRRDWYRYDDGCVVLFPNISFVDIDQETLEVRIIYDTEESYLLPIKEYDFFMKLYLDWRASKC